jgi:hypothetical protein
MPKKTPKKEDSQEPAELIKKFCEENEIILFSRPKWVEVEGGGWTTVVETFALSQPEKKEDE